MSTDAPAGPYAAFRHIKGNQYDATEHAGVRYGTEPLYAGRDRARGLCGEDPLWVVSPLAPFTPTGKGKCSKCVTRFMEQQ